MSEIKFSKDKDDDREYDRPRMPDTNTTHIDPNKQARGG